MSAPRAGKTTLTVGLVRCPILLYKPGGKPEDLPEWEKAGPHGGKLYPGATEEQAINSYASSVAGDDDKDSAMPSPAAKRSSGASAPGKAEANLWEHDGDGGFHPVAKDEIRRGVRLLDGTFVDVTESIEQITERTKLEEMRIVDFIRTEELRRERVIGSYWVAADPSGDPRFLRLLFEAMREEKRVAVMKWTKRSKQSLGALVPMAEGKTVRVLELTWHEDERPIPQNVLHPAQIDNGTIEGEPDMAVKAEELEAARELVRAMSGRRADSLDTLRDDTRGMARELRQRAEAGEMFELPPAGAKTVGDPSLREALLASADPEVLELVER